MDWMNYMDEKRIGVFIDQYLPFHPDRLYHESDNQLAPYTYYSSLCNFFEIVEKNMRTRIIIAAHPKSDYDSKPDYFCGRDIIKGNTANLIKESSFVIAHASTSINFALLYFKPLIFITTDGIQKQNTGKNIMGLYISAVAASLDKTPINIDRITTFDWDKETQYNEEAYIRYINLYIKKLGSPDKPMWDIFYSYINGDEYRSGSHK